MYETTAAARPDQPECRRPGARRRAVLGCSRLQPFFAASPRQIAHRARSTSTDGRTTATPVNCPKRNGSKAAGSDHRPASGGTWPVADDPPLRGAPKCLRVASEKAGRAAGRGSPARPVSRHESRASRPTAYSPEAIQALVTGRSAGGPGAISFSCSGRIAHSPRSPGFPARSPIRRVQCSATSGVGYSERADAWELSAARAAVVWWGEVWTLSDRETCAGNS